jgi:AbiV family abortive infection protein
MHACYRNAVALLQDARLLAVKSRCARALSLTIIAIEELGKILSLCELLDHRKSAESTEFWKLFRKHAVKQADTGSYGSFALEATGTHPYSAFVSERILAAMDSLKQAGFYVDFRGGAFGTPGELAETARATLDHLFAFAEERADSFAQFHSTLEQSQALAHVARADISEQGRFPFALEFSSPAVSEVALKGVLLSYASESSAKASIPDYGLFLSCTEELLRHYSAPIVGQAALALARALMGRANAEAKVKVLPTSVRRAWEMTKLLLAMTNQEWCPAEVREPLSKAWAAESIPSSSD